MSVPYFNTAHLTTVTLHRRGGICADWEDLNLERLVLEPSPAAAAAALRAYERPKSTRRAAPASRAAADRSQSGGTASSSTPPRGGSRGESYPAPAGELPFDGAHVLEAYGLSPATTTGRLEAWLELLQLQPLGPVVRHAGVLLLRRHACITRGFGRQTRLEQRLAMLQIGGWPMERITECGGPTTACKLSAQGLDPFKGLLRWVDEECALVVFATPDQARLALERAPTSGFRWRPFAQACALKLPTMSEYNPVILQYILLCWAIPVLLRPLNLAPYLHHAPVSRSWHQQDSGWLMGGRGFEQASVAARALPAADLAPPQPRPKTTAAVARRLIGAALGDVNGLRDKVRRLRPDANIKHVPAARAGTRVGARMRTCWRACMAASSAVCASHAARHMRQRAFGLPLPCSHH